MGAVRTTCDKQVAGTCGLGKLKLKGGNLGTMKLG